MYVFYLIILIVFWSVLAIQTVPTGVFKGFADGILLGLEQRFGMKMKSKMLLMASLLDPQYTKFLPDCHNGKYFISCE